MKKHIQKSSFNTDDGIRRAAMVYHEVRKSGPCSFNTDDGIRRAAMKGKALHYHSNVAFQYR